MSDYSLEPIKIHVKKVTGWSMEFTERVAKEYLRFMTLKSMYNGISPSDIIDIFWHNHILSTKNYYNFCQKLCKRLSDFKKDTLIHHKPEDSYDQRRRKLRKAKALSAYNTIYKSKPPVDIWQTEPEKIVIRESGKVNVKVIYLSGGDENNALFPNYDGRVEGFEEFELKLSDSNRTCYDLAVECLRNHNRDKHSACCVVYDGDERVSAEYMFFLKFQNRGKNPEEKSRDMKNGEHFFAYMFNSNMGC